MKITSGESHPTRQITNSLKKKIKEKTKNKFETGLQFGTGKTDRVSLTNSNNGLMFEPELWAQFRDRFLHSGDIFSALRGQNSAGDHQMLPLAFSYSLGPKQ